MKICGSVQKETYVHLYLNSRNILVCKRHNCNKYKWLPFLLFSWHFYNYMLPYIDIHIYNLVTNVLAKYFRRCQLCKCILYFRQDGSDIGSFIQTAMSIASVVMNIFGGGDATGGALDLIGSLLGGSGDSPQSAGSKGNEKQL